MEWKKITAIVRAERLEDVEQRLMAVRVGGITVSRIKGYGEYKNFFSTDLMITHVRIEIFTEASSGTTHK